MYLDEKKNHIIDTFEEKRSYYIDKGLLTR
jgi:hypothetical protein